VPLASLLAGCTTTVAGRGSGPPPAAKLTAQCVAGVVGVVDSYGTEFFPAGGELPADAPVTNTYTGYELTLVNKGTATADVAGFAVAFYGIDGREITSDRKDVSAFITPGQAQSWLEKTDQQFKIVFTGEVAAVTCKLVHWYPQ
jgi:hypothetical protein